MSPLDLHRRVSSYLPQQVSLPNTVVRPLLRLVLRPLWPNQYRPSWNIPIVLRLFRSRKTCHLVKPAPQLARLPLLVLLQAVVPVLLDWPVVVLDGTLQGLSYVLVTKVDAVDTDIHLVIPCKLLVSSGILL